MGSSGGGELRSSGERKEREGVREWGGSGVGGVGRSGGRVMQVGMCGGKGAAGVLGGDREAWVPVKAHAAIVEASMSRSMSREGKSAPGTNAHKKARVQKKIMLHHHSPEACDDVRNKRTRGLKLDGPYLPEKKHLRGTRGLAGGGKRTDKSERLARDRARRKTHSRGAP